MSKKRDARAHKPIDAAGLIVRKTVRAIDTMFIRERAAKRLVARERIMTKMGIDTPTEIPSWVRDLHFFEAC